MATEAMSVPNNCPQMPCAGCQRTFIYPATTAVRCPVCNGSGSILVSDYRGMWTSSAASAQTCHGCGGKGWVTV